MTPPGLLALLHTAAAGAPPPADLAVETVGAPDGVVAAVLGFFAHNLVARPLDPAEVLTRLDGTDVRGLLGAGFVPIGAEVLLYARDPG